MVSTVKRSGAGRSRDRSGTDQRERNERSNRDRLLQILALVEFRIEEIRPDSDRGGLLNMFGGGHRSELSLLRAIRKLAR